ncbi:MAG: hypothetical protein M3Z46_03750 [Actinomycetota bacterium]|nr:hypothetical protein [Actinomycetota bacterium]
MSVTGHRRTAKLALGVALVLLAGACQVRTDVDVRVDRDGSGAVGVTVQLDGEAAARIPDLASQVRVADLRHAGWRVEGPSRTAGRGLRMSASKPFGRPSEAGAVLEELAGRGGPFRAFTVSRTHSFARTTWAAKGTVDLSRGLAAFSDQRLTALLGGKPFGRSEQDLLRLAHGSLAGAAPFRITVRLPGARSHTSIVRLGDQPLSIDAISRKTDSSAYLLAGAAALALLAALAVWVLGGRMRRRPPRAQRGMGTYLRPRFEPITETEGGPPPGTGGSPELVRVRPPSSPRRPRRPPGRPPPTPRPPPDR